MSVQIFADWKTFGIFPVHPYKLPSHILREIRWLQANVELPSA